MPTVMEAALATVDVRPVPELGTGYLVTLGCCHGETRLGYADSRGPQQGEDRDACIRLALIRHRDAHGCRCTTTLWRRYVGARAGGPRRAAGERTTRRRATTARSAVRASCHPAGGGLPWVVVACVALATLMFGGALGLGIGLAYSGVLCIGVWLLETVKGQGAPRALPPARTSIYEWRPPVRRVPWWSV